MSDNTHTVSYLKDDNEILILVKKTHLNSPPLSEFKETLSHYFDHNYNEENDCSPQFIIERVSPDSFSVTLEYYPNNTNVVLSRRIVTESEAISLYEMAAQLNMDIFDEF